MGKVSRVRTGCWTCKERHRKCDEAKPFCNNCIKSSRECGGYGIRLLFDVDDKRNLQRVGKNGQIRHSFIGRPKSNKMKSKNFVSPVDESPIEKPENSSIDKLDVSIESRISDAGSLDLVSEDRNLFDAPMPYPPLGVVQAHKLESFSTELYESLEYLVNDPGILRIDFDKQVKKENSILEGKNSNIARFVQHPSLHEASVNERSELYSNMDKEMIDIIEKSKSKSKDADLLSVFDTSLTTLSYQEENKMLKHFFKKLLPLLDGHPNSPWPDLALKYCDFNIARSCFISLACMHIYESREGGKEYYHKGLAHINKTMDYLLLYIKSNSEDVSPNTNSESESNNKRQQISSFVILVLVNVNIMFAILQKGTSSFSRFFFKIFGLICQEKSFYKALKENDKKMSLVLILSWFDTVSAITSPDCRLPFCSPNWYGSCTDSISTAKMMGCPGEIFRAMSKVCLIRHDLKNGIQNDSISDEYEKIKLELFKYRDYVMEEDGEGDYNLRLKGAQCWALAIYITLNRAVKVPNWESVIRMAVNEFIETYGSMEPQSAVITQMVWPLYAVGCECKTIFERKMLLQYMETLYQTAQMGTLYSLINIVQKVWISGSTQEEILEEWLDEGVDYLPL